MANNIIFSEYKLNRILTLKNRIVMAPMTRAKASDDLVPTRQMADYYARRADAGLIITEGTVIEANALGHQNVPGIFTLSQINHWKQVTQKVHEKNGLIFLQIWHVGRVSHPDLLQGNLPIAPSATLMTSKLNRSPNLFAGKSRAATLSEIQTLIEQYANAANNAMAAGFDGIEIHGANGYLIDQFLHHITNKREDEYGGSPENMSRFALEVVKACGEAIGYERVGIRLSPGGYLNEIVGDEKDAKVFSHLLNQLNHHSLAYVHTGNFDDTKKFAELSMMTMSEFIRIHYQGTLIACGSYILQDALQRINQNEFNLVALGRSFIANADLISRLQTNQPLIPYNNNMLNTLY